MEASSLQLNNDVSGFIRKSKEGSVKLFAQFGGQGVNYWGYLHNIFVDAQAQPQSSLWRLIQSASELFKRESLSPEARSLGIHEEKFDLIEWLSDESKTPDEEYRRRAPISYPLILLTQLCQYLQTASKIFQDSPIKNFKPLWKGATGHSQGVVAAIVISVAEDDESFYQTSLAMLGYFFWMGLRMQQCFCHWEREDTLLAGKLQRESTEGMPTPMVAVVGLPVRAVQKHAEAFNRSAASPVEVSLINGPRTAVCSGSAASVHLFVKTLQKFQSKPSEDQARIPFSKRKASFRVSYLGVSVPFHTQTYLAAAPALVHEDLERLASTGCQFPTSSQLAIPVYSTLDGTDLRKASDLMAVLTRLQCVERVEWEASLQAAVSPHITHVVDFGPGGRSGAGGLTSRLKDGTGVATILAGVDETDVLSLSQDQLFSDTVTYGPHWEREYAPQLVRLRDGKVMVSTKFSRLIGKPPVLVAGMTPTTANEGLVAAFTNGGFHGELAGGGQATEEIFRERIKSLSQLLNPGEGIHLNIMFLNPKQWGFQFPSSTQMRKEGIPIDSITVAAGVPSVERASEILHQAKEAGMSFVSFKPGSVDAIREVVEIARHNPEMPIVLQFTGGRAGGHHSFEDVHQPILATYSSIRRQKNVVLVVGSGIGDGKESMPFLTGQWSVEYGFPPMPFDGILVGSRIMVAKEALTSDAAKELIVSTPGVHPKQWEQSYEESAGGVITVISELGEPIHKIENRGVKLWREFDRKFFSLPVDQREKAFRENKDYIISRVNADYQKVYFGKKKNGQVADLDEMTYEEVASRMVELMFKNGTWIHDTYSKRFEAFLSRTEERLSAATTSWVQQLAASQINETPHQILQEFMDRYPIASKELLAAEDIDYFLHLCKTLGKPVNFIPAIDKDFSFWFKKDSLWQSENLELVEGEDVERVCILQGPVAVAHSNKVNEPVTEILDGIHQEIIESLQQTSKVDEIPVVDYLTSPLSADTSSSEGLPGVTIEEETKEDGSKVKCFYLSEFEANLPSTKYYRALLAGNQANWWNATLSSPDIIHEDKKKVPNYLSTLFSPRSGQRVCVTFDPSGHPLQASLYDAHRSEPSVEISKGGEFIHVSIHHFPLPSSMVALPLKFAYRPDQSFAPIHRQLEKGNELLKDFYAKLWFPSLLEEERRLTMKPYQLGQMFTTRTTVSREALRQFLDAVGVRSWVPPVDDSLLPVPVDFAIVACWEALIKTLFPQQIDASLLSLLHLSYSYQLLSKESFYEGDTIDSRVRITEINNMANGKRVSVKGTLAKGNNDLIEVSSQFFFPGHYTDFENTFSVRSLKRRVEIKDAKTKAILESKSWFHIHNAGRINVGDVLIFDTEFQLQWKNSRVLSKVTASGKTSVLRGTLLEPLGTVQDESYQVVQSRVEHYLMRYGQPVETIQFFEDGGYAVELPPRADVFRAPAEHDTYSRASGDFNPIHTNPHIAAIAGLSGPITHGMWTAAHVRTLLQQFVAQSERVRMYRSEFLEKVSASEQLQVQFFHVGIKDGLKLVEIKVHNNSGQQVMKGTAEVEEPLVGFAFTGQGSAQVGMGMDLYASSPVAKQIWDAAEVHLLQKFGFSILDIVRKNPKELTVHFGGTKGQEIRRKYMELVHEVHPTEGEVEIVPLFPEITETTESHTFRHPQGLLFATQFTQPALTLLEKAFFADMQAKGLVSPDSLFAGHSLGEYAALSSVANILTVEALVELVFIRGITMQNAVVRDSQGRSSFSMIAANPQRVGPFFTSNHLSRLVDEIGAQSKRLIEVVNYNVQDYQYIVTGHNSNLEAFRVCADTLKKNPKASIPDLVGKALDQFSTEEFVAVQQGAATIPLPGIDVPFHSKFLDREVPRFREYLKASLHPSRIDVALLEGKYIPNLTATPFEATIEYAKQIIATRDSAVLKDLLASDPTIGRPEKKQLLAYHLLVELLAFQFASPVRWIETQDYYFSQGVGRFIELGPGGTLKGMAQRTLASGKYSLRHREILTVEQDHDIVYYLQRPKVAVPEPKAEAAPVKEEQKTESVAVIAPPPPEAPSAAATPIVDAPVSALETLRVLLALKLKKPLEEISPTTSIKDLVGGKSAMQNEILGDLQKEFQGQEPENAAEISLQQLGQQMGAGYEHLGAPALKQVSRLISSKMPGGFGMAEIKEHLFNERNLGPGRTESILMHALTQEPPSRIETIQQAREWLDSVVDSFGSSIGLQIGYRSKSSSATAATSVVNSEELIKFQKQQERLIQEVMKSYSKYLDVDPRQGHHLAEAQAQLRRELEDDLKIWEEEHGKRYADGIRPKFDSEKMRRYTSFWNWGRQEAYALYFDTLRENPARFDGDYCQRVTSLINRGTPELVQLVSDIAYRASQVPNERVARHVSALAREVERHLSHPPLFRLFVSDHRAPFVEIVEGRIRYSEVSRPGVNTFEEFVVEMQKGFPEALLEPSGKKNSRRTNVPPRRRSKRLPSSSLRPFSSSAKRSLGIAPYLFLNGGGKPAHYSEFDQNKTKTYFSVLKRMSTAGQTFQNKTALVTGCGRGSIGLEIVKALLTGGARVIVTTSSFSKETTELYRNLYQRHGGKGSELIVFPFNQASTIDIKRLIDYLYSQLEVDLDFVLPFAAISETGRDITNIDSLSELSHRLMLTNLIRLIGTIKSVKEGLGKDTRPTNIVLPLSPNHGVFGGDGLYAESKSGQESLFNKWHSEGWENYLSLTGAVIGWTRGTGLMEGNNIVAHGIEQLGVRTFNQQEMAFAIVALCAPEIVEMAHHSPVWADLTGGMALLPNLHATVTKLRRDTQMRAEISRAVFQDTQEDDALQILDTPAPPKASPVQRKAHFDFTFPTLPSKERLAKLNRLEGMVNLDKTVVIVGFGEVGPWGNARTRWEMESFGEFSLEGCIELAWIMGFIRYHNGPMADGRPYIGWLDAKTGAPVKDSDVKNVYEENILKHCGIREIEPELFEGYNPHKKEFHREVVINEDMPPFEVISEEEAQRFRLKHGDKVDVFQVEGRWYVQMKKGAELFIPSALKFDRFVAGQIPTGWSAARYGIPKEITDQVDPVTLYNLVSTVEAFVSAGIVDPYEFYEYVHVSEVGNTSGGGIGGMRSLKQTFRERMFEKPVQADILQEIFINVMPAWVNMLLLSSSGPIKTPVGACATAAESVEVGVETIQSGKAKIVIVGGYDDFGEESSYEFAQMKATSNSADEVAKGRHPREMSRPTSDTRSGFMESHGAGTQVLATASLAVEMGLPIYAIVGFTSTATDKAGRSVPAPGQGILTTAREVVSPTPSPLLDLEYRRKQLEGEREFIANWKLRQLEISTDPQFVEEQALQREKAAQDFWGNSFWMGRSDIAPLRGALAVWGLTIDDLGVASFHGTSTKANDKNESQVTQLQMDHLGRRPGNALFSIFQKYLTGHPKGAAAAWMANGLVQTLLSGRVPPNRNADNIDSALRAFDQLIFFNEPVQTSGLEAGLLKSFGFGQASAEILLIHPDYVLAALPPQVLSSYEMKRNIRERKACAHQHLILTGKKNLVQVKSDPPYRPADEASVYLDPTARASYDPAVGSWQFQSTSKKSAATSPFPSPRYETPVQFHPAVPKSAAKAVEVTMREMAEGLRQSTEGVGVDVQLISEISADNTEFLKRNFTQAELNYCCAPSDITQRQSRLAGRWAAKEAVVKALSAAGPTARSLWPGSAAPLRDIEVLPSPAGPPQVHLHGYAASVASALGCQTVTVTLSHSGDYALAQARVL